VNGFPETHISLRSGMPVKRASSVGSVSLLSLKSSLSNGYSLSIPASEDKRFERRLRAVMAGSGFRVKECSASIMQLERFRALRAVREAKQSGIWVNKFSDRSRECKVFTSGAKLVADIDVRELSARLRCFRNLHLVLGNMPASKFEVLPRGLVQLSDMLECELPDPDRLTL